MTKRWLTMPLEACIEAVRYPAKVPRTQFLVEGDYPVISQEQAFINGYWSEAGDVFRVQRPVVVFGDHTRVLKYVDFDFVIGADGVKVLQTKRFLDPKYLYHYLQSIRIDAQGYARHFRFLKRVDMRFPESLADQQRIVTILDEAFAGIDAAIKHAEKNLTSASGLFESWIRAMFSRNRQKWVEKHLGCLAENLDSKRIPITKSERKSGDVPYYGASGVVDHVADYIFNEDLLLVSEDGANLLARTYPIAFSISGKAWVNNHAHVLRFSNRTLQRIVEYYLNSISLAAYVSGMAQPKLNQKALNTISIPVPPEKDQAEIVSSLDALAWETDRLTTAYQRKLAALAELKQSILQKAFAGELTGKEAERELAAA